MINDIKRVITMWLSNPINIRLAIIFTYSMVLYMMYLNLTMHEFIFVSVVLCLNAFFVRLSGVARGMFMAMIEREAFTSIIKEMKKQAREGTPGDGKEVGPWSRSWEMGEDQFDKLFKKIKKMDKKKTKKK